jgi:prepilin-type N-terminal cleavage/methylation domain-containing protein
MKISSKNNNLLTLSSESRRGFTLIETLIVLAIIIILSAVAVPSFKHLIISQRLQAVAYQMVQDLRETKEDAILYQQDLNVYFSYNNSPIEEHSATNFNNREYCFETFQKDSLASPPEHYIPRDSVNNHFKKREPMKYNIVISNISSNASSSIDFSGKKYFAIAFRSGAGDTFRGQANIVTSMTNDSSGEKRLVSSYGDIGNTPVVITLEDVPSGQKFYVRISATGKISMYGSPTPY